MSEGLERSELTELIEFHLRKNDHVITFKWEGNGIEVGSWFVTSGAGDKMFAPYQIDQARNMWKRKIKQGYVRVQ